MIKCVSVEKDIAVIFDKKYKLKKLNIPFDYSTVPNIRDARLLYVRGTGELSTQTKVVADSYWGLAYVTKMTLRDIPLVQIHAPGCPTCCSILATGYGIDNADSPEIKKVQRQINADFINLDTAIETIEPILQLLDNGLYIIADATCFPTDGDGNFFWNVSNEPKEYRATAGAFLADDMYRYICGQPVYLYPTESTDCYNSERVQYYIDNDGGGQSKPRAIVYNFSEFISFVIDGHHKACAAARMGVPLDTIMIIPCSGYRYEVVEGRTKATGLYFSSIKISVADIPEKYLPNIKKAEDWRKAEKVEKLEKGDIVRREWEAAYIRSAARYPKVEDYAEMIAAGITDLSMVTDAVIAECVRKLDKAAKQKLRALLCIMWLHRDMRLKRTALECAEKLPYCTLKKYAFEILAEIKGDEEIEQFFVDYLVECEDKYDPLLPIVDRFWA